MIRIVPFIFRLWCSSLGPVENTAGWWGKVTCGNISAVREPVRNPLEPDTVKVLLEMDGYAVTAVIELKAKADLEQELCIKLNIRTFLD